jgi:hypothetical protein
MVIFARADARACTLYLKCVLERDSNKILIYTKLFVLKKFKHRLQIVSLEERLSVQRVQRMDLLSCFIFLNSKL